MQYKILGKSGLRVSEICLGTMTFGEDWGWGSNKDISRKVFNTFVDKGGNFIDTANIYTQGTSENYLGEFMGDRREKFVLATKYTLNTDPKDPNASGNHRKNMIQAVEKSLKRLKTDYIDLYYLHAWDNMTPIEEVMRTFDDLVRQGKVLYCGISDTPAWIVSRGQTMAELRGMSHFVSLQLEYSLLERTIESEFLPMSNELDIAITAWSPLAMGALTGKYLNQKKDDNSRLELTKTTRSSWNDRYLNEKAVKIVQEVVNIAKEIGRTPAQVALCWLRQRPCVCIPIIGAKNVDQLVDNLACVEFELTWDQISRLDEVSKINLGFPHEFLKSDDIRPILYGETYDLIDKH